MEGRTLLQNYPDMKCKGLSHNAGHTRQSSRTAEDGAAAYQTQRWWRRYQHTQIVHSHSGQQDKKTEGLNSSGREGNDRVGEAEYSSHTNQC